MKMNFLKEITNNSLEIVQNPFGNYVIQHILDEWGPDSCRGIIDMIISNIVSLSMQKFSSNVVEKCFDLVDNVIVLLKILVHTQKINQGIVQPWKDKLIAEEQIWKFRSTESYSSYEL